MTKSEKISHDLEETIRGKVALLLEETMEKSWGIYIPQVQSDITDKLQHSIPAKCYIPAASTFQEAKKSFKTEFLKNQLELHHGNVSQLAKFIGLDRRSVHRAIQELRIQNRTFRKNMNLTFIQEKMIDQTIRFALEGYRDIIQPHKMEKLYQELPALSRNIAKILPYNHLTWKQAEREFERQFLTHSLEEQHWKIAETAHRLNIQPETLHRKISLLGLRRSQKLFKP